MIHNVRQIYTENKIFDTSQYLNHFRKYAMAKVKIQSKTRLKKACFINISEPIRAQGKSLVVCVKTEPTHILEGKISNASKI